MYRAEGEVMLVDEDVEEGARDLLELNDEVGYMATRKRGRRKKLPELVGGISY